MKQSMRIALLSLFAVGLGGIAQAQPVAPGGGGGGTGVSPYLNLLRNNTNNANPAFNYLTITRPQMALAQQANQLNQNLQLTNQQLQQQQGQGGMMILGADSSQPYTGHRTTFGVLGSHFNSIGGASGAGRFGMNQGIGNNIRPGGGAGAGGIGAASGARGASMGARR